NRIDINAAKIQAIPKQGGMLVRRGFQQLQQITPVPVTSADNLLKWVTLLDLSEVGTNFIGAPFFPGDKPDAAVGERLFKLPNALSPQIEAEIPPRLIAHKRVG